MKKEVLIVVGMVVITVVLFFIAVSDDGVRLKPQPTTAVDLEKMSPGIKAMVESMSHIYPPFTPPEKLPDPASNGAALYKKFCTRCHGLINPAMHTSGEWRELSAAMFKRIDRLYATMGMVLFMKTPTPTERETVVEYLVSHSMKHAEAQNLPDAGAPDAALFSTVCSQCHSLPDPGYHMRGEWGGVVERMRRNMKTMQKPAISDDLAREITKYLEKHS